VPVSLTDDGNDEMWRSNPFLVLLASINFAASVCTHQHKLQAELSCAS
jgi:hypothetical protein